MCITESLLYSRDCHNIVNQLYFNKKKEKNKIKPPIKFWASTFFPLG